MAEELGDDFALLALLLMQCGRVDLKTETLLEDEFHHDGRGPELQRAVWTHNGVILKGFEYYNPEDVYEEGNIKHLELVGLEAYSMAGEEVHGNILATGESKVAVIKVINSPWMKQFNPFHLEGLNITKSCFTTKFTMSSVKK